ncbi:MULTISPECIES: class E sortase [Streptomycetaceae]|uniref:Sortase family protein n=1 Tax=Streptantibioticus cattleyicolor (strain ATCC 35852 / DSM 46488 / JCM 4925 / NBRC 14057 / NRRL 8057) TaxID=1003195 RepID=F8JSD7_STREN|nr:class E sortase [Streptantibioticus cattleyicolor]AEW95453.1 sortase family protein [Streptantibioticus cattleyicolor NRRL 8057 = DSM 46488]MYS60020.1 class E sortase [Streptomyces sp. SID5468]CCB75794.1 putative membrane protein [Streptantibioticus cattleyicolor NRRL 8057 = DSM 46488]
MTTTEHDDDTGTHATAPHPAAGPHRARGRGPVATAFSVIGELMITLGVVLALFVAYSLWWTNVLADRQARREGDTVRRQWAAPSGPGALDTADGIGFLHVPAMGRNFEVLVKKGTSTDVLNQGVAGYYTDPVASAMPWDRTGNFTTAAHRDGHGAKFHNIDKVRKGDAVVFETRDTWYVYRVFAVLDQTSKYDVHVLDPVPRESGVRRPGRYITLTTCTPVFTSEYRYIVWGELVRTQKVDAHRTPPPELG